MHPVLVEVPWPELGVPLWPAFVLLSAWGAAVAWSAMRRKNRFVLGLGAILTLAALILAFTTKGARYTSDPVEVRAWGVTLALALTVGAAVTLRRAAARGIDREIVVRACIAAAFGGVLGARIGWVLLHAGETGSADAVFAFYRGGLSAWGGIFGALVGAAISARKSGASLAELCDSFAPSFGASLALTRFGCFLEGCDFGVPVGSGAPHFLAVLGTFPKGSPAWVEQVLSRGLSPSAATALPVHPTELYEAVLGVALVALAIAVERRKLRRGFTFASVLFGYLVLRVSLDWLRDDRVEMWVSVALLSLAALGGGVVSFLHFRSREK